MGPNTSSRKYIDYDYGSTTEVTVLNCIIVNCGFSGAGCTATVTNTQLSGVNADAFESAKAMLIGVTIKSCARSFYLWNDVYVGTYKNVVTKNITSRGFTIGANSFTLDWNHVNPDYASWVISWAVGATGRIVKQYEFDLTTDTSATVTLKNGAGSTVFSVTSDAVTGKIATQTVSQGYYDQAHGNTLQDYGPFRLAITKTGKMSYTETGIVLTAKTAWEIKLRNQLSGDAFVGDVTNGKKFYKDDADTQLTGTYNAPVLTGNATPPDVSSGKTFYKDDPNTKLTGTAKSPSILVTLDGHILARVGKDKPNYISL